uniref:SAND domain-containing protein n=1 Tax=Plectus sambesii TaxID=2011161 RepID=A0A914W7X6_9BILA
MNSATDLLSPTSFGLNGDSNSSVSRCSSSTRPDSPIGAIPNSPYEPKQHSFGGIEKTHEKVVLDKKTMGTGCFEGKVCITSIVVAKVEKEATATELNPEPMPKPESTAARCRPFDTSQYPRRKRIEDNLLDEPTKRKAQCSSSSSEGLMEELSATRVPQNYGIEEEADDPPDSSHSSTSFSNEAVFQSGKGQLKPKAPRKIRRNPEKERENDEFWRRANELLATGRLPVTCGAAAPAMLITDLLGCGTKGRSILKQDGSKITPRAYEIEGGMGNSCAWLKTIRFLGKQLDLLVQGGLLQRHDHHCMCRVCTDGVGNKPPILHVHVERSVSKVKEKS